MNNKSSTIKIVVFGADNSGKTTLAKKLSEYFVAEYKHSLGPVSPEDMIAFMLTNLSSGESVVFDRLPIIEEAVCGKILRGVNKLDSLFDVPYLSLVDYFVFCCPPIDKVKEFGDREQMDGVKSNIDSLYSGYQRYADYLTSMGFEVIKYDYTKDNFNKKFGGLK